MALKKYNYNYDEIQDNDKISSDFTLFLNLLKELIIFLFFLIPYILLAIFYLLFNFEKSKKYFTKIVLEPFKIFLKIWNWFFEARYTAYLILFLIFMYFIEILFLQDYMDYLMVHTTHIAKFTNFYSTITSIFLHANISHLLSNSFALLIFGRIVEKQVGSSILWIFLASGIISNLVSNYIFYLQGNFFYSLGASGAIAGIIIFAILFSPFMFTSMLIIPLPIFFVGWGLIFLDISSFLNNTQDGTNHLAHISGYLTLLILFFFLEIKHKKEIIKGFFINLALLLLVYFLFEYYKINIF